MDPQSPPFTIAILGGGLAGLALAISLLHQSIPVKIYEAASCFSEIGAGVAFGPNTLRAIAAIDPALNAAYERCATRNAWSEKRRKWMAFRLGCDVFDVEGRAVGRVGDLICEDEAGEMGQCSVHRAKFLGEMVNLIPEGVAHFGKTVVDVQEVGEVDRRRVRLTFSDGGSAEASAAVGCDGIKSRVRRILLGEDNPLSRPRFVGEYAFRGLIPMGKAREVLGEYAAGNGHVHIGYGG
jgi:salicylate hydroxylase